MPKTDKEKTPKVSKVVASKKADTKVGKKAAPKVTKAAKAEKVIEPEVTAEIEAVAVAKPAKPKKINGKVSAKKAATIKKFQKSDKDTGSTSVQIAVLTEKINQLSKHLANHKKDNDSRMGLLKMISQRRSLLGYLEKRQPEDYRKLLASLGLRK